MNSFKRDPNLRATPRGVITANGAVFDIESALPVSDTDVVTASALGHSYSSMFEGVTASYKGATKMDFWTKRIENAIPDSMGLQTAGESYRPRRILQTRHW